MRDGGAGTGGLWNAPSEGRVDPEPDLDGPGRGGRRRGRGPGRPPSRRRRILKWTALGATAVVAAVAGLGTYLVLRLDGNIKHTALLPAGATQAAETPDKFGHTAMNILVIGTDARVSAADCALGGDCSSGGAGNSDVMIVVHLAADRSNSTIMSIPRDTMTQIPDCGSNAPYYGMINSSMQYGASCTVAAVNKLTGLTIDHYMEVDFEGVVNMSNALGGVPVCVSDSMYDKDSGLRLNAGTTVIKGKQALEFVRTRHGFYDGSDLGREKAQHIFLSDMIRQLRSEASLTNLANLYSIANAATQSLQVDDGLAGVTNLISLFNTMNKVPTDRVTFVTMPWELDPANTERVIPEQAQAEKMFSNIENDVAYSSAKSTESSKSTTSTDTATSGSAAGSSANVVTSQVHARILNSTGVSGRASDVAEALTSDGFSSANLSTGNTSATAKTVVYYPSTRADSAAAVAEALGIPSTDLVKSSAYSQVTVVIGTDWSTGTSYPAGSGGTSAASAASAPSESSALNAATTGQCVQVASNDIVN